MKRFLAFCVLFGLLLNACSFGSKSTSASQPTQAEPIVSPEEPSATAAPTNTSEPTPTAVPPTETPSPPTPTATEVPPTATPTVEPTVDMQAAIASAKIILFEDMWYARYIKPVLDEVGYTYTDVSDKMGDFKEELLSDTKWDLVIAAAEGRGRIEGEFYDYLYQQLENGASVILEMWTLDWVTGGRIQPILDKCGIEFQANWVNPSSRGVYWSDPNHPLANQPNEVSLTRFVTYWTGDIGDLVRKTPGSNATIVGSANAGNPEQDGLITVCYDGRLLIQTFSTHDHAKPTAMQLWQNYVDYMLAQRFNK
jgi:hypothetical protein